MVYNSGRSYTYFSLDRAGPVTLDGSVRTVKASGFGGMTLIIPEGAVRYIDSGDRGPAAVCLPSSLKGIESPSTYLDEDMNQLTDLEDIRGHAYIRISDGIYRMSDGTGPFAPVDPDIPVNPDIPSDDGDGGDDNTLLFAGIGVAAAVLVIAGLLIWRSKH